jgi:uncharacterized protein (DUF4415 family)
MSKLPKHLLDITDEEEAEIQRQIASDPDDEELSDESARRPMSFSEAVRRQRGRPPVAHPKQHINIRLDADLVDRLKADGPGWQSRANDLLRKAVGM